MASPMALTRCLPILLLVAMTATTGAFEDGADFYVKCYPPPTPTPDGGGAFRGNLLSLLEALPSAAALTGFASLQTDGRTASDRALVRGLCSDDSAPEPCRRCLTDGGKKLADQCGESSRRAAFWDERCFVVYADGANSSASADDEFGTVFFTSDADLSPDVVSVQRLVAFSQSLAQRAAKNHAAFATTPAYKGDATTGNRTVLVLAKCHGEPGSCYLLFDISTPPPPPPTLEEMIRTVCAAVLKGLVVPFLIGMVLGVVLCALMVVYDWINDRNAAAAVEAMSGK